MNTPSRRTVLRFAAALPVLPALAVVPGCSRGSERHRLTLASGPVNGPYAIFGKRLADVLERRGDGITLHVRSTSASVENLRLLGSGQADLAMGLGDSAADAVVGLGPFSSPQPVTALARVYLNYTHLVVAAGSPVRKAADLAGRKVSLGADGSGTAVVGERVLNAARLSTPVRASRLGLDESVEALANGEVEAFFWSGGVPTSAIAGLTGRMPIRLVPLDGLAAELSRAHGPTYVSVSVPAGTYGQRAEVPTVGVPSYLMARPGLSSTVAYEVTRAMFESRDSLPGPESPGAYLDERYAIGTGTVPLHPGAVRYYRSVYG
ncbi:TAXI family TRAP transporter solute-binding subunit [Actinomadura rudentiformis]|uniref:TAXI family TRAP transporter solute-binding subunit n=1 Tax=Actinomadura rudentiformis TaxID=359158 RepID=A0A6H9YYQ5_9ACTN|nr:TAXI family TRAP transporter solute-binding subunit [Actinomadura rudentiformis]KAB2349474.1 TAXI family TRAP transporter solute-binding subunit [Actinomadura rudentiformis]